jgi:predicted deacylase
MLRATASGAVLYHVVPGDHVREGDPLVTILTAPGEEGGAVVLTAPQDGLILTRRARRLIRLGDDLLKLVGGRPSPSARPGTLEN